VYPNSHFFSMATSCTIAVWMFSCPKAHILFINSPIKMKIGLIGKPYIVNCCIFLFCPYCKLKPSFLSCSKSVYSTEILNRNSFRSLWRILWMEYQAIPNHMMPSMLISLDYIAWLPEVLLSFLVNTRPVPKVIFLPSCCLPLQN
jgi:hypothetical protein